MLIIHIPKGINMPLQFDLGKDEYKDWIISETEFHTHFINKYESIMSLGNGYMGLRSALEERYLGSIRNLFLSGTFNRFSKNETTELPNAADITQTSIIINGNTFHLKSGKHREYRLELNLKDGELTRSLIWESPKGQEFYINFRRFVSMDNLHLIGMKIEITPINTTADVSIISGIDGTITNSGSQHFEDGKKRIYNKKFLELNQSTTESHIDFVFLCHNTMRTDSNASTVSIFNSDRRRISQKLFAKVHQYETLTFEKKILVYTTRDKEYSSLDPNYNGSYSSRNLRLSSLIKMRKDALRKIKELENETYDNLIKKSIAKWQHIWEKMDIQIDAKDNFDQLAIRFALYHMIIMTPEHDNRYSISSKGLSGERYKGHTFWDTETFILPMFMFEFPQIARNLLEYRYLSLPAAKQKAQKKGFQGAMYPWESAWINYGEAAPIWGGVDINTGKNTIIPTGFIEQHISADIAFAVNQYFSITNDRDFMDKYGFEIIFETASFWASRAELDNNTEQYVIKDIMGPDEYKIYVNNNAYTNYMAHWNIQKAIDLYAMLKDENSEILSRLETTLELKPKLDLWKKVVEKLYLPKQNDNQIIPQDDSYLNKEDADLSKYKGQSQTRTIFQDYNLDRINQMQVTKQADVLMLFYMLENKFSSDVKKSNWDYYEPRTLHDSSLSLSIHTILAADILSTEDAYSFFERASRVDIGLNMKSSDEGIHAGAMGGIWQDVVFGFGGVRVKDGMLHINPRLPQKWKSFEFPINWRGDKLKVITTKKAIEITRVSKKENPIEIIVRNEKHQLSDKLKISLKQGLFS